LYWCELPPFAAQGKQPLEERGKKAAVRRQDRDRADRGRSVLRPYEEKPSNGYDGKREKRAGQSAAGAEGTLVAGRSKFKTLVTNWLRVPPK